MALAHFAFLMSVSLCAVVSGTNGPDVPQVLASLLQQIQGGDAIVEADTVMKFAKCVNEDRSLKFSAAMQTALDKIIMKRRKMLRLGLRGLASAVLEFVEDANASCGEPRLAGAEEAAKASRTLHAYTASKVYIEYEKLKSLTVGGADLHVPLNAFIGAWKKSQSDIGKKLADLILPFLSMETPAAKAEL